MHILNTYLIFTCLISIVFDALYDFAATLIDISPFIHVFAAAIKFWQFTGFLLTRILLEGIFLLISETIKIVPVCTLDRSKIN